MDTLNIASQEQGNYRASAVEFGSGTTLFPKEPYHLANLPESRAWERWVGLALIQESNHVPFCEADHESPSAVHKCPLSIHVFTTHTHTPRIWTKTEITTPNPPRKDCHFPEHIVGGGALLIQGGVRLKISALTHIKERGMNNGGTMGCEPHMKNAHLAKDQLPLGWLLTGFLRRLRWFCLTSPGFLPRAPAQHKASLCLSKGWLGTLGGN